MKNSDITEFAMEHDVPLADLETLIVIEIYRAMGKYRQGLLGGHNLHEFLKGRNCSIVGCYYGSELNDYCVCCGVKRPTPPHNYYGESLLKEEK